MKLNLITIQYGNDLCLLNCWASIIILKKNEALTLCLCVWQVDYEWVELCVFMLGEWDLKAKCYCFLNTH